MEPRFNQKVAPGIYEAMLGLGNYLRKSGLEESLVNLVCLRASQINGCAYCIDMHWKDLRAMGQSEETLYMLNAWRESAIYTEREQAALPDDVDERARVQFSDAELVNLTLAIGAINSWNRLNVAFRTPSGMYRA